MKAGRKKARLARLHRLFWAIYAVSSVAFVPACGVLDSGTGWGPQLNLFLFVVVYMIFQQALFIVFIRMEGIYSRQTALPVFYAGVIISSMVVSGIGLLLVVAGLVPLTGQGYPAGVLGLAYGNLATALSLSIAFASYPALSGKPASL